MCKNKQNIKNTINLESIGEKVKLAGDFDYLIWVLDNLTESQLATIIENAIVAINKKKAERQGETVDVGFWDSKGEYIEDVQMLTPEETIEIGKNAEVRYV